MGNKRALLPWLITNIEPYLKEGKSIVDLFSGTASVGYALKPKYKIIANDIQEYSSIISEALLKFNYSIKDNDFDNNLNENYLSHLTLLEDVFCLYLKKENKLLKADPDLYFNFSNTAPLFGRTVTNKKLSQFYHLDFLNRKRQNPKSLPYILFSLYYSHTFYSLRQCIEIDSLRYAIDQIKSKVKRSVYLSCLLFAINKSVSSTGHFAEHLNANSVSGKSRIMQYRKVSVYDNFLKKLNDFRGMCINNAYKNEVYNLDYKELIFKLKSENRLDEVGLFYIDPPYTSTQYSRFYHIPETLVKYDYPIITKHRLREGLSQGRYREERYQSTFSQLRKAKDSFHEMFRVLSENTNATLALSYSDNSIIKPIDDLIEIAKQYYTVSIVKNGYSHSAQGSRFSSNGKGAKPIHEHIIICRN